MNDYNQNTYMVGNIKQSLLIEVKFQELAGDYSVKMRGKSSIDLKNGTAQAVRIMVI